ncbi:hypothetical protein GCM10010390_19250 [Streptomyces mordarskii]|uniref:Uncharacterized protein n=1 Tax=Streptomyces mordarskii TaxID=1226758 RepID=A0ABP3MDQ0_9ACTN
MCHAMSPGVPLPLGWEGNYAVSVSDTGLTGWRNRAYRNQVELSMAAAACLRWARITGETTCDREAVHSGVLRATRGRTVTAKR